MLNHHRHHFQEVDLNKDGVIDYSEFLTLVKVVQSFTSWNAKFPLGKAFRAWIQEEKSLQAIVKGRQQLPLYHFTITITSLSFLHTLILSQRLLLWNLLKHFLYKSTWFSGDGRVPCSLQVHFKCTCNTTLFVITLYSQETVEFLVPYKSTYQNQYSCSPPPLFMLLVKIKIGSYYFWMFFQVSLMQATIFVFNSYQQVEIKGFLWYF